MNTPDHAEHTTDLHKPALTECHTVHMPESQQQASNLDGGAMAAADSCSKDIIQCGTMGWEHSVTASMAPMLEFKGICYWLPAKPPSLKERVACSRWRKLAGSSHSSSELPDLTVTKDKPCYGKQLLDNVSGAACAGRLLAIMGPSGEPGGGSSDSHGRAEQFL